MPASTARHRPLGPLCRLVMPRALTLGIVSAPANPATPRPAPPKKSSRPATPPPTSGRAAPKSAAGARNALAWYGWMYRRYLILPSDRDVDELIRRREQSLALKKRAAAGDTIARVALATKFRPPKPAFPR